MRTTNSPGIYAYSTKMGTRYAASFRDSGGRQTFRRGFTSIRAAQAFRSEMATRARTGTVRVSRETFGAFFTHWLERRAPYLEAGTLADYETHGRKRLLPAFGTRRLSAIDGPAVELWLTDAARSGRCKPKTLNNSLGVLVGCLNDAVKRGFLPGNPASTVQRLPLEHHETDFLRLAEIPRYLDVCRPVYRPLAELLIGGGLRISEAISLRWKDVELDAGLVRVYRSSKVGGEGSTKGDRFRSVQIGPRVCGVLANLRAGSGEQAADLGSPRHIFLMPVRVRKEDRGRWSSKAVAPLDRNTVSRAWHKEALTDAGLRDMPLHALRHTAAAAWLATGRPLVFVQRQLGHSSITTTERIYGHLERGFLAGEAALTEAAIWGATQPGAQALR